MATAVFFRTPAFFDDVIRPTLASLHRVVWPALTRVVECLEGGRKEEMSVAERALVNGFCKDSNVLYAYKAYQDGVAPRYLATRVFGKLTDPTPFEEKVSAIYNFGEKSASALLMGLCKACAARG